MFDFITKGFSKLMGGSKSERDVKEIQPFVDEILKIYPTLSALSNDELRNKTVEFRARISEYTKDEDTEIAALKAEAETPDIDIDEQEKLFNRIDELHKKAVKKIEEVLEEILPEAF